MSKAEGVVIEAGRGWAVIMSKDGRYRKIKTGQALYPGQFYYAPDRAALRYGLAAAVLLLLFTAAMDFFNVVAYASVTPGIDLGINRWDRVVSVKTNSDEAARMVTQLDIGGKTSSEAVAVLVSRLIENDQRSGESSGSLDITVHSKNNDRALGTKYQEKLMTRISGSIDEVLKVHEKINFENDTIGEKVSIQYKRSAPGLAPKMNQEGQNAASQPDKSNPAGKKTDGNNDQKAVNKDDHSIPAVKQDAANSRFREVDSTRPAGEAGADSTPQGNAATSPGFFSHWMEKKTAIDWPEFKNMIKPGQEKKDN